MPDTPITHTDLSVDNGWIPVQTEGEALLRDVTVSAVEAAGRKVVMTSEVVNTPRFVANGVDVVAEHAVIPLKDATVDAVTMTAHKFANRFAISIEDEQDAIVSALDAYKREWLSNFAIAYDNAALGVTGTGGPFESVYKTVGTDNVFATAGDLTYEDLADVIGALEANRRGELVVIAHPSFKMGLRNLKDAAGERVVALDGVLGAGVPTLFGNEILFSYGAKTSAAYSDNPTGNAMIVVANKRDLIVGVRSGPESMVSEAPQWENDNVELKMRARRGFVLADKDSARVIELTAVSAG